MRTPFPSAHLLLLILILLSAALPIRAVHGQSNPPGNESSSTAPRESETTVVERSIYVPFDRIDEVLGRMDRGVLLPYREYQRLLRSGLPGPPDDPDSVASGWIERGRMTGRVEGTVAQARLELVLRSVTKKRIAIPLALQGAVVTDATSKSPSLHVIPTPQGAYAALLSDEGSHRLVLELGIPVSSRDDRQTLLLSLPNAAALSLSMTLAETGLDAEILGARTSRIEERGQETVIEAAFAGATSATVGWQTLPQALGDDQGSLTSTTRSRVRLRDLSTELQTRIAYNLLEASAAALELNVPSPLHPRKVSGAGIRNWEFEEANADSEEAGSGLLKVDFDEPVQGSFTITLDLEASATPSQEADGSPSRRILEPITTRFASRETGELFVSIDPGFSVRPVTADRLIRVDPGQLTAWDSPSPNSGIRRQESTTFAYRYSRPNYNLTLDLTPIQPQIHVESISKATVTTEEITLESTLRYRVRKTPVFELGIRVPSDLQIDRSLGSPLLADIVESRGDSNDRVLLLQLLSPREGNFEIPLRFRKTRTETRAVEVRGLVPLDVVHHEGQIAIAAQEHLEISLTSKSGLTPLPVRSLDPSLLPANPDPKEPPILFGFRKDRPDFALELQARPRKSRVHCETVVSQHFFENRIEFEQENRYEVLYAEIESFRLLVPESLSSIVRFEGPGIRERIEVGALNFVGPIRPGEEPLVEWRIDLQSPVLGTYRLTCHLELPLPDPGREVAETPVLSIVPLGVDRETGYFVLSKESNLEIDTEVRSPSAESIDIKELPTGSRRKEAFRGFRFLSRPAWLRCQVIRHEYEKVLSAIAELEHLETVVARSGRARTLCRTELRTSDLANLEVDLPRGSRLLTASVDGIPTRPTRRDGTETLGLALPPNRADSPKSVISLLYEQEQLAVGGAAKTSGSIPLRSPVFRQPLGGPEIPVFRLSWKVFLPEENQVLSYGGNMIPVEDSDPRLAPAWTRDLLSGLRTSFLSPGAPTRPAIDREAQRLEREAAARKRGGYALDVDLVREGASATFYRLEGPGEIVISYVSPAVFSILRLLCFLLPPTLLIVFQQRRRPKKLPLSLGALAVLLVAIPFTTHGVAQMLDAALLGTLAAIAFFAFSDLAPRYAASREAKSSRLARQREADAFSRTSDSPQETDSTEEPEVLTFPEDEDKDKPDREEPDDEEPEEPENPDEGPDPDPGGDSGDKPDGGSPETLGTEPEEESQERLTKPSPPHETNEPSEPNETTEPSAPEEAPSDPAEENAPSNDDAPSIDPVSQREVTPEPEPERKPEPEGDPESESPPTPQEAESEAERRQEPDPTPPAPTPDPPIKASRSAEKKKQRSRRKKGGKK